MTAENRRIFYTASIYVLPSAVLLAALWLPFGFSLIGLIEEWDLLSLFTTHGLFFSASLDGPLPQLLLRPLTPLTFGVAYFLDRDSFIGWHLVNLAALLIKAGAIAYLIGHATTSHRYGVMAAVLLLLYPADTMQLSFRSIHINLCSAFALLAASICYKSFYTNDNLLGYIYCFISSILLFTACLIYEAALIVILFPIAFVFIQNGVKGGSYHLHKKTGLVTLWLLAAILYIAYAFWAAKLAASYQGELLAGGKSLVSLLAYGLPKLFSIGALRALLGGWIDAVRILVAEYSSYNYLFAVAIAIATLSRLLDLHPKAYERLRARNTFLATDLSSRLIAVGFVLMLLGYAPFLLSGAHLAISQRTFIWATPGAVMVWLGVLGLLARFTGLSAAFASLTVLGFSFQLFQVHHYSTISESQRSILKEIVEKFDGNLGDKTLIVMDGTHTAGHTWMFRGKGLAHALTYLYGHWIGSVEICHQGSMEWQRADGLGRKGTCIEDETGWTLRYPPSVSAPGYVSPPSLPDRKLNRDDVIVVPVGQTDALASSYRAGLEHGQDTIARRYRNILKQPAWPIALNMFKDRIITDHYKWDFGDYWSMEIPTRGSGWREAEWLVRPWSKRAVAWQTREEAQLYFEFAPEDVRYRLHARFVANSGGSIKEQMGMQLNGRDLTLRWISEEEVAATIPPHILQTGENRIDIKHPTNPEYYGLSVLMDWIEILRQ